MESASSRRGVAVLLWVGLWGSGCNCGPCSADDDCDDGQYCTGIERCRPTNPAADRRGCISPNPACLAGQFCVEVGNRCMSPCGDWVRDGNGDPVLTDGLPTSNRDDDRDGDGVNDAECGGVDCDDLDPHRRPGLEEVCDPLGHDEDCNEATWGALDRDLDGHLDARCFHAGPDGGPLAQRWRADAGFFDFLAGTDCDDFNARVFPLAGEVCNGIDDDCDGQVDEGTLVPLLVDADGDGFGRPGSAVPVCNDARGYTARGGDCDDTNPQIFPGSIVCLVGGQGTEYHLCRLDGAGWDAGVCTAGRVCVTQPGGHGICR
ncbi:MAG: putative metal-binding motif-containing protein [Archangiaceae bacterium]|nr:putative metal-binding motif-containing protein [Archangiaceae bacterium]